MASSSPKTRGENSKNIWSFTNNQPKLSTAFITAQVLHVICVVARGAWSSRCSLSGCVVVVGWEVAWQTSTDTGNPHRIFKYCSTLQSQALDIVDGNQKSGINSPVEVVFFLILAPSQVALGFLNHQQTSFCVTASRFCQGTCAMSHSIWSLWRGCELGTWRTPQRVWENPWEQNGDFQVGDVLYRGWGHLPNYMENKK